MEWSEVDVFKVINLFRQFPCLWDFQSPLYKRLDKKKHAWEEIAKHMGKAEDIVKKKIKNLRSAYLVEKKKVVSSKKSGSSVDALYTPHLYYFNEMRFLDRAIGLRQTTSSLPTEETEILEFSPTTEPPIELSVLDPQYSFDVYGSPNYTETDSPIMETPTLQKASFSSRKRKAERDKINVALDAIIKKTNEDEEKDTMFTCFGKSVGLQLEKMPLSTAMDAMAGIQKLLTTAVNRKDILEASMIAADI